MNEIAFLQAATESRRKRLDALRMLRDISKKCNCARCKTTVVVCRASIKKGSK